MNRKYEVMIIFDAKMTDEQVETALDKYRKLITKDSGVISDELRWGVRTLAYPIAKKTEGNYQILQFETTVASRDELHRLLGLDESVLRHKILKTE
ncbi:MAG: 30S ribosomal protein S6 [Bifidobacteriaceae bacterium]|jgi:small subunit ribosomal protein S6|nr:30S ribosomal protein S6 [Bifidobacteriaceae bacterium]